MIARRPRCAVDGGPWAIAVISLLAAAHAHAADPYPIKHVIMIMQENRSFDHYFGTFPGVDGIPPGVCISLNPAKPGLGCVRPFHDPLDVNAGGPHNQLNAQADLDDGITTDKMDGFLYQQSTAPLTCKPDAPACAGTTAGVAIHDAVSYHNEEEIPNYWAYARRFVLQDQLYEGVRSWSWPSHLDLTSEWVATCLDYTDAKKCETSPDAPAPKLGLRLPWANLFDLLQAHGVSWKYYLGEGPEPDCEDDALTCDPQNQVSSVPSIWNPPPYFASVAGKGAKFVEEHDPKIEQFLVDVKNHTLPQVSWIVPAAAYSEHPAEGVTIGMEYVTSMVNAVMRSPYWKDTAIFIAWDDWGGFYDHKAPPNIDTNRSAAPIQGFGIRVPGIMISAYAKAGLIDHSVLSFDSYATFIEDLFTGGARLDPAKLGIPDNRPDIRDALTEVEFPGGRKAPIGNLIHEFDFKQPALPPLVLSTGIPTGIAVGCKVDSAGFCTSTTVSITWNPIAAGEVPGPLIYHVVRDSFELAQCIGTAATCNDTPGGGLHLYRAYSVDAQGNSSPESAAAEAIEPCPSNAQGMATTASRIDRKRPIDFSILGCSK